MADKTIEYLKEELSKEEQLLESLIKSERFFKRHKKKLMAAVALVALAAVGYIAYDYKKERDLLAANEAYAKLLANPDDAAAKETLRQKSPRLYELYLFKEALQKREKDLLKKLAVSKDPVISDLAGYHFAALKRDVKMLQESETGAILADLAKLDAAYLLDLAGAYSRAFAKLESIPADSAAKPYATLLRHYGVAK